MTKPDLCELPLAGAFYYRPTPHQDHRGSFSRLTCAETLADAGLNTNWVQTNLSRTKTRGTVRGMHYQTEPFAEIKLLTCLSGRIFDVLVDLRPTSSTYGQWTGVELDGAAADTLYIPAGFAHGFQTLSDDVTLHYSHSAAFHPDHQAGVSYCDPQIGIRWPLRVTEVSERDANLPQLTTLEEAV
ncbi:dTDP-4-dehydrorhamnose 3,5-epimerase family protein [Phycobacter sp. K97]|uniref:dTDP-4-dehydrorhamnose 3,5-epimerase family protein n=1 Tax=Phycobacter sedimenti TaxID=3133977 RepID=UPI00311F718E